jgi:hypothetical protein
MSNVVFHNNVTEKFGSPWTPFAVRGVAGWYDAADPASVVQSAGLVSQWDDKSGNDYHATQGNGANQFLYTTDPQGRRAMRLDTAKYMNANGLTALLTGFGLECFVVASLDALSGANTFFRLAGGVNNSNSYLRYYFTDFEIYQQVIITDIAYDQSIDLGTNYGSAPQAGSPIILNQYAQTLTANGYTGVPFPNPPLPGPNGSFTTFEIGNLFSGAEMYLYELIFFPSSQGTTIRQKIEGYLAHKWGLTGNLPVGHPYKTEAP